MNPFKSLLLFFVFEMVLVLACTIVYGYPTQLTAITDILTQMGTNNNDFALLLFIFGSLFNFFVCAWFMHND